MKLDKILQIEKALARALKRNDQETAAKLIQTWRQEERRLAATTDPVPGWRKRQAVEQPSLF